MELEEACQLHADTDTGRSSAKEQDAVIGEGPTGSGGRQLRSVKETGEDDCTGSLNVVVEDGVPIAEGREERECLREFGC